MKIFLNIITNNEITTNKKNALDVVNIRVYYKYIILSCHHY